MRLLFFVVVVFLTSVSTGLIHLVPDDYDNYLFRDNVTSAQVVVTSPDASPGIRTRLVVAFPAGNSGLVLYFNSTSSVRPIIKLVDDKLRSINRTNGVVGIAGQFNLSVNCLSDRPIMGSIRTVRDFTEAGIIHPEIDQRLKPRNNNGSSILYTYRFFYDNVVLQLLLSTSKLINYDPQQKVSNLSAGVYNFEVVLNLPSLTPLPAEKLLRDDKQNMITDDKTKTAVQSIAFLTYKEKFLAGGWHFLTYFGRDTLISTRLLLPLLSTEGAEAALGAVFDRINQDTGEICHEEGIGDYAGWRHNTGKDQGTGSDPIYTYQMIDTNYELLPLLAAYFLDESIGKGRASQFLARNSNTQKNLNYSQILDKNIDLVMAKAQAFSKNPTYKNLVYLKPNSSAGNWRDSNSGLGYGRIPYDVNVALMPSSLLAIERLANASIISRSTTIGQQAANSRKVWEDKAASLFQFNTSSDARRSLADYLDRLNLPSDLSSSSDELPKVIHALSLKDDGTPVEVMNSDISFNLMYHDALSADFMRYVVSVLQPFPRGLLMDGVGLLIANPAYDSNRADWDIFTKRAYHGICVWAFQEAMTAIGLDRQVKLCDSSTPPSWCSDSSIVDSVKTAHCKLLDVIGDNSMADFVETWTWSYDNSKKKFIIKNPSEFSVKAMEPDAVQLWSFALLNTDKPSYCDSYASTYSNAFYLLSGIVALWVKLL